MRKENKKFLILLFIFFLVGLWLQSGFIKNTKQTIIQNNALIVGTILKEHPELEEEIIRAIESENYEANENILEKYGLTNLESLNYLEEIQKFQKKIYIFSGLFFLSLILFLYGYFCHTQKVHRREIEKVDQYLFALLSNDIKVDLKDFQSGELATLQNDLMKVTNRLKNALERSTKDKQELAKTLADISHQLKTPLTSLVVINDALTYNDMDDVQRKRFLKKQEETLSHIESLIQVLLKTSQIESGMIELKKERVNMEQLIQNAAMQLEVMLIAKNIQLEKKIEKGLYVTGDPYWLEEALLNIIKNACEHSKQNDTIKIKAQNTPMYTELIIEDEGEGIDKKDLPHIFKRFYKSSPNKDSIGIGLNLTKSILDRTNATIRVESKKGVYTRFIIHFYTNAI